MALVSAGAGFGLAATHELIVGETINPSIAGKVAAVATGTTGQGTGASDLPVAVSDTASTVAPATSIGPRHRPYVIPDVVELELVQAPIAHRTLRTPVPVPGHPAPPVSSPDTRSPIPSYLIGVYR